MVFSVRNEMLRITDGTESKEGTTAVDECTNNELRSDRQSLTTNTVRESNVDDGSAIQPDITYPYPYPNGAS